MFQEPRNFLIFQETETLSNFPRLKNKKKSTPKKLPILQKIDLSISSVKKFLIFSQKKAVLIFQETETPKKFILFQKTEISNILGNGKPKKLIF